MVTLIGKAIGKSIAENKKAKEAATATTEAVVTEAATEATVTDADPRYPVFEEPAEYSSDAMRERGVPEELIEFYEKYPEVAPYAWFFPEKHEIDYDMDISKEVTKGTIPYFCQWDDRWGYKDYGSSYMGVNGCGPTCITMVYSGLTGKTDYTPYDNSKYYRNGWKYYGSYNVYYAHGTDTYSKLKKKVKTTISKDVIVGYKTVKLRVYAWGVETHMNVGVQFRGTGHGYKNLPLTSYYMF